MYCGQRDHNPRAWLHDLANEWTEQSNTSWWSEHTGRLRIQIWFAPAWKLWKMKINRDIVAIESKECTALLLGEAIHAPAEELYNVIHWD